MFQLTSWLVDTSPWPARWNCGAWDPLLGWGTICALGLLSLFYVIIPTLCLLLVRRRPQIVPDQRITMQLCGFMMLCGVTSVVDAVMFWWPAYRLAFVLRAIAVIVSIFAAWRLWRLRELITEFRSPTEYRHIIAQKDQKIANYAVGRVQLLDEAVNQTISQQSLVQEIERLRTQLENKISLEEMERMRENLVRLRRTAETAGAIG